MAEHVYTPLIKKADFCPAPYAGKLPKFADSRSNKDVVDTRLYEEFWEEVFWHCIHGYNTGGLWIPGMYWHYLNFVLIDGPKGGKDYPFFSDLHYELSLWQDDIQRDKFCAGGIMPKARRKGLSFWGAEKVNWGHRFIDSYRSATAAGIDFFTQGFYLKVDRIMNNTVPEMQLNILTNSSKELITGYTYKSEYGWQDTQHGYSLFQTLQNNASKLEGEYFNDVFFEETGENKWANEALQSVSHALKDGNDYVGKIWVYGTGGSMTGAGAVFADMCTNFEALSLKKYFIPRYRFYKPYIYRENQDHLVPNLIAAFPNLPIPCLIGCEDIIAAKEGIAEEIVVRSKHPDKRKLKEFLQDMPETEEDIFNSSGHNDFDTENIYHQNYLIDSEGFPRYREYTLEWETDSNGQIVTPRKVKAEPAKAHHKEWQKVLIYEMPNPKYKGLDIQGVDGYDIDKVDNRNKSLGGIVVVRNYDEIQGTFEEPGVVPIVLYYQRPPKKEMFWEMSLKISVLYEIKGDCMIGADSDMIIGYYKDQGFKHCLSPRPRSLDAKDSKQTHDYGIRYNGSNKLKMISMLQSWVAKYIQYSWFKALNNDIAAYDAQNMGNDWDAADALGNCLVRKIDRKKKARENDDEDEERKRFEFGYYDAKGNYFNNAPHEKEEPMFKKGF